MSDSPPISNSRRRRVRRGAAEPTIGEVLVRIEGLGDEVSEIKADAREARDRARDLAIRATEQNVPAQIAQLRGEMNMAHQGFRNDLVSAVELIRADAIRRLDGLDARMAAQEEWRAKLAGAGGVFGWIAKNMSWLLTIAATAMAALSWARKL